MRTYDEMVKEDFDVKGIPHGWIQWKGTDVCIDVHCECGHHGHIDEEFFYYWKCSQCGKVYKVGANIKMIPLTDDEAEELKDCLTLHEDQE